MEGIRSVFEIDLDSAEATELHPTSASDLRVKEKQIENWMATNPKLLFTNPEALMLIAQEVTGELMADILAVDSQGNLIIIEIKRHSSDRSTIGQILDYAARLASYGYEEFNSRWQSYSNSKNDLLEEFRKFVDNPDFAADDFLQKQRLFILASSEDESMKRIIGWLRDTYTVPVDFVPFQFYRHNGRVLLEIGRIDIEPLPIGGKWSGDWFFNTNETNSKGAYKPMLDENVIALYGYPGDTGRDMLMQPALGDRIFAYVNKHGIIAVGKTVDEDVFSANSVFGEQERTEFHRRVEWETAVNPSQAVSPSQVSQWGYNLPVRSTLCKMYAAGIGNRIADKLAELKRK